MPLSIETSDLKVPSLGDILNDINPAAKGIFGKYDLIDHKTKKTICNFESFLGWTRKRDSSLPSSNVEKGSFVQYNKIITPNTFTVTLAKTGLPYELTSFDKAIQKYAESTKTVDIVLPIGTFLNYNIKDVNDGIGEGDAVNMLVVQMTLVEIRESFPQYNSYALQAENIANPKEASTVNLGQKQPSKLAGWFGGLFGR